MDFIPEISFFKDKLQGINVSAYETSRNHLQGSVTYLSPFITHGFESLPNIVSYLKTEQGLTSRHKLFAEFGWREYYYHVWSHLGDAILQDIRPPLANIDYACVIPEDILHAQTGLAPIDLAINELYSTGYLHNHARMWLACYLVHYRKIAWRVGADWMYGYLFDGDLASNHLSWQWVASTFSHKPYLFNAENVAKFAPPPWHCFGTVLDQSYEALERIARNNKLLKTNHRLATHASERPNLFPRPPKSLVEKYNISMHLDEKMGLSTNHIHCIHPWDLRTQALPTQTLGILHEPFHHQFPWSEKRWDFVLARMSSLCRTIIMTDFRSAFPAFIKQNPQVRIDVTSTFNPFYKEFLAQIADTSDTLVHPIERFLPNPEKFCSSFSKFWQIVNHQEKFPKP